MPYSRFVVYPTPDGTIKDSILFKSGLLSSGATSTRKVVSFIGIKAGFQEDVFPSYQFSLENSFFAENILTIVFRYL